MMSAAVGTVLDEEASMSTLTDRPHAALVVIDVQNDVVAHVHDRAGVLANIQLAVDRARASGVAVVWVQDAAEDREPGSEAYEIVPELDPVADEPRVQKQYGDAFEATDLEGILAARGVGRLYIAGAQTDACIRSTLHGAITRGYDTVLVSDAHTTEDLTEWGAPSPDQVIAHTNLYWQYHTAPGREAGVTTAADLFG
jgi:nicotinamidase-related amidase